MVAGGETSPDGTCTGGELFRFLDGIGRGLGSWIVFAFMLLLGRAASENVNGGFDNAGTIDSFIVHVV